MESHSIKVFRLNMCDWWAGVDLEYTIKKAVEETGTPRDDLVDEDYLQTLTFEDLERLTFIDMEEDPPVKRSFKEQLDMMVLDGEVFPTMFASTEY